MWRRAKSWRWAILVVALLLGGLAYAFWPTPVAIDVGKVTRGPLIVGITDDGVTRANDVYTVSAPVTGYLARIELEAGDPVRRGAVVATMRGLPSSPLDPRSVQELRAALASAEAAASGAQASLAQARSDLSRAEALAVKGFIAKAQLEAARTRVATGQAALAQSRAEAARIRAQLGSASGAASGQAVAVRAPAGGSILSLLSESEGVIAEGTPIMTIGNPRSIEAVVDLLSRDAVRVKPGQPVVFSQWGGTGQLTGTVDRIEPYGRQKVSALGIEEQRVNVIVHFDRASAAQAQSLGHGFQFDATIVLWRTDNALRLPIGALFRGPDRSWHVFVVDKGRVRDRAVELNHMTDEFAEVRRGVSDGEAVVLNPSKELRDGSRVRPRQP
jgi:HlyD family secretion protein